MAENAGSIGISLTLLTNQFEQQIKGIKDTAKKSGKEISDNFNDSLKDSTKSVSETVSKDSEKIESILNDTEKSLKSKAASIAAIYRKQGDSMSESFEKAWSQIERSGNESIKKSDKSIKKMNNSLSESDDRIKKLKKSSDDSFGGISSLAKKAGAAIAASFAVKEIVNFGKECIDLGSDLSEVQNVVDVTFTSMREQINQFAQSATKNFGLSETMAKQYAGTLGAMAKSFGFAEDEASAMSTTLTGLAGDVASFYNISQDEAFTKLKSVFTGETESLKDLGIVMTQTALDEYALAQGISKTTDEMSESEKVALRYKFVVEQLNGASGDFARTSDGWANQMRILNLQFDSFKANIGQGLINALTPALKAINTLMEKLVELSAKFKEFTEFINGKTSDSQGGGTASGLENIKNSTDEIKESAKKAKKEINSLMGFDQINKLSDKEEEKDSDDALKIDTSGIKKLGDDAKNSESAIDKLKEKLKSLFDTFKEGFDLGFANADLENLKEQAKRVVESLQEIFTDPRVVESAKNLGTQLVETLGVITGSVARVAVEWGAAILGGIADSLEKDKEYIVTKLVEIMDATSQLIEEIGNIFLTLADIFTADVVLESLRGFAESVTSFFTTATLTITEVAVKFALAIVGGIADSLEENKEIISEKLSDILDTATRFFDDLTELFRTLGDIFTAPEALESLRNLSSDITTILSDLCLTAVDLGTKFGTDLIECITVPIVKNKEKLKKTLTDTLKVIEKPIETIKETVRHTCEKITQLYDEHIKPLFDSLKEGISQIVETLLDGYNKYILPVLDKLADKFEEVVEKHIQPAIDSAIDFFGEFIDCINEFWKNILQPFINWVLKTIMPIVSPVIKAIGTLFLNTVGGMFDKIKRFFDIAKQVASFFKGAFSVNIKGAMETVKNSFKSAINAVIQSLNKLIDGLNIIDVPDSIPILGGIGNIPKIPMLAEGGYVKANTPRLAMIGDNTKYGEIVSPENKLLEMAKTAASMSGAGNAEILEILKEILKILLRGDVVTIDEEALRKYFIKKTNQNTIAKGKSELIQ